MSFPPAPFLALTFSDRPLSTLTTGAENYLAAACFKAHLDAPEKREGISG
jgi:hypothetical protein